MHHIAITPSTCRKATNASSLHTRKTPSNERQSMPDVASPSFTLAVLAVDDSALSTLRRRPWPVLPDVNTSSLNMATWSDVVGCSIIYIYSPLRVYQLQQIRLLWESIKQQRFEGEEWKED